MLATILLGSSAGFTGDGAATRKCPMYENGIVVLSSFDGGVMLCSSSTHTGPHSRSCMDAEGSGDALISGEVSW